MIPDAPRAPQLPWRIIDGAYETELALGPSPDSAADCNTYLLRTPEYALVIDPGADAARAELLADALRALAYEMPRQVVVFLTHCHADHCHAMDRILDADNLTASLACHKAAADILRAGGGPLTGADKLHLDQPGASYALGLFAMADGGVTRDMDTPGGGLRSLSIPISARDALQIYHTPGHSPDGLSYRVGCALFVGDIPCTEDDLPELPGHDPQELIATLNKLLWLMDHANVVDIYPGHGPAMTRAEAKRHFKAMLQEL